MRRFRAWTFALALLGAEVWATSAEAQLAPGQSGKPLSAVPNADAAGYLGWFNANKRGVSDYNDWYNRSVYGGLSLGYYWTEHLKTEIELAWTSEAEVVSYERLTFAEGFFPVPTEHYYRNAKVAVVHAYQFSRNAWFHPFLGAGLEIDWERQWEESPPFFIPRRPDSIPESRTDPRTDVHLRAAAAAGFKAYLSQRAFFRTDLKFVGARRLDQVIWRFGFGVDFN